MGWPRPFKPGIPQESDINLEGGHPMSEISVIGIDLAKNIFQLHAVNSQGKTVLQRKMKRESLPLFFANIPQCLVGMEACSSSSYWARVIESCGHNVKRIHPRFVKPYLMADKNDANDAAAICEAVQRPHMRFVPNKSQEQSDIQAIHRVRKGFVQSRTATMNQIRGLLAENGIIMRQGACHIRSNLPLILDDYEVELSASMRSLLRALHESIKFFDRQIQEQEKELKTISQKHRACRKLMKIPGVGILTVTMLAAVIGKATHFKCGRNFSAYLGLVPRQHTSGGKLRLLGITKRGDRYTKTLLTHGARSTRRLTKGGRSPFQGTPRGKWLDDLIDRCGSNMASVALANKRARIAWSMLANDTEYLAPC